MEALETWSRDHRGIAKVVTGGGKTIFAILCINHILEKTDAKKILILVPSIFLLDQWEIEIKKFLTDHSVSVCGGGSRVTKDADIIISTMDSSSHALKEIDKTDDVFLIVDECHRTGSSKRSESIKHRWFATLGLSATPERDHDDALEEVIVPSLGDIIFNYDYNQAYRDGVIADFSLTNVYVPMDSEEELEYESITKRIGKRIGILGKFDKNDQQLRMLLLKRARLVNSTFLRVPIVPKIIKINDKRKWLVFSESIEQADLLNALLDRKGYRSAVYHTGAPNEIRRTNLRRFIKGTVDVLISCRGLDEGFDVPNADAALILSSSSVSRQRIQRMGRVLRKSPGKLKAKIYTFYSSDPEKERLIDETRNLHSEIAVQWLNVNTN